MSSVGPVNIGFTFPDSYSLNECFEHFEINAKKAIEEKQREINNQIISFITNYSNSSNISNLLSLENSSLPDFIMNSVDISRRKPDVQLGTGT
jgi:hypothetical protein